MENSEFVKCSLVEHHRVLRHRLCIHLLKCRRRLAQASGFDGGPWVSNTRLDMEENWDNECNYSSYVPPVTCHFKKPPPFLSRSILPPIQEEEENSDDDECSNDPSYVPSPQEEENWDNECNYSSYVPPVTCHFKKPPPFLSRNERKQWRLNQRQYY